MPTLTPLSDILSIDKIQEYLSLSNPISGITGDIKYKDHTITGESASKHEATHKLTLVFSNVIGFSFPGSDIKLLVNPADNGTAQTTEIDIEVYYKWNVLKFDPAFNINNVPVTLDNLLSIITNIYNINLTTALEKLIAKYEEVADTISIPIQAVIDELNRFFELAGTANEISFSVGTPSFDDIETKLNDAGISLAKVITDFNLTDISDPTSAVEVLGAVIKKGIYQLVQNLNVNYNLAGTPNIIEYRPNLDFTDVITKLTNIGKDALQIIKDLVLDLTAGFDTIKQTLFSFLTINTTGLPTSFKELFIPEVDAKITDVSLALEFPRSMLIPMNDDDEFIDAPAKAKLTFEVGDFTFSTQNGFDFQEVSTCELKRASIIETGMTIEFTDCVIDFHTDSNISQADDDNRPLTFQGIFINTAIIKLPKFWQTDPAIPTTAIIEGSNLLIGSPGGITGELAMKTTPANSGDLLHFTIPGVMKVSLKDFDITLAQNVIDETNINGTLTIPLLKKPDGNESEIDINVNIADDTYTINLTESDPFVLSEVEINIINLIVTLRGGAVVSPTSFSGNMKFPVLNDGSEQNNLVPILFEAEILENSKKITVDSVPPLSLLGIAIALNEFDIEFNDTEILNADITGTITFPYLNDPAHPDQPFALGINYVIKDDGFEIHVTEISRLDLLGIGVQFESVDIVFDKSGLDSFNLSGELFLPIFTMDNDDSLGFDLSIQENQYKFICSPIAPATSLPPISLFGIQLILNNFELSYTNSQLDDFELSGEIIFPVFTNESGSPIGFGLTIRQTNYRLKVSDIPCLDLLGIGIKFDNIDVSFSKTSFDKLHIEGGLRIPFLVDENNLIHFDLDIQESGFNLSVTKVDPLYIQGIKLEFNPIALGFTKDGLDNLNLGGKLTFPVVEQLGDIGFNFNYSDGKYIITASLSENTPLSLGGLDITLSSLTIAFNDSGIIANETAIAGKISIPAFNIDLDITIELKEGGFFIEAKVPDGAHVDVLDLEDLINVQLSSLAIGKKGSNWSFGFSGKIINHLSVPGLEKFVPKIIEIDKFDLSEANNIDLNFGMEWPNGFKIPNIGAGGSTIVPVNQSFGDVMSIRAIQIDSKVAEKTEIQVTLLGTKFSMGPVTCVIDGIGLEAIIEKKENGNMGPLDVSLGFVPPKGIGISLESDIVSGGGYLFFDHDNNRYAGAIELSFKDKFVFTAIGLLTTVLPDGTKGTSLLIIITTQFPAPIPLGYNFYLAGVGGLLGIHRTVNADKLREGVATNAIDNILFPEDVIANISRIVSDLRELFPPKRDQFLIGPMAMITWNSPPLLSVELGLIIEFDDPFAIIILGVIKAGIPTQDMPLIKIQVNFIGVINFDEGYLSFDAALFDSRIVSFTLEGSLALRLMWGDHSDFALSVGGFHPAYIAPSHLKFFDMKRLTISLMGGNPRISLTSYFAITTNTVQFGASIDFLFKVWKVKVIGWFGFDVLFQFDPFKFIAAVSAGLTVKWGSTTLFSISLSFTLAGPSPWIAKGTGKFKILWSTHKVRFNKTWGEEKTISLPDIRVLPLVIEALESNSSWKSEISATKNYEFVVLRSSAANENDIILATHGTLTIEQKIVPLGLDIERFGNSNPIGETLFELTSIGLINSDGETILDKIDIRDDFVPAAYKNMADSDKLSAPSFEKMRNGIKTSSVDAFKTNHGIIRKVEYEVHVSDAKCESNNNASGNNGILGVKLADTQQMNPILFTHFAKGGAISRSSISKKNKAKKVCNIRKASLNTNEFKVVCADTLQKHNDITFSVGCKAEANEAMLQAIALKPSLKGKLLVVQKKEPMLVP